jgi:PleD family two-component response regulator
MHKSVAGMPMPGGQQVRVSAGIAELRHGETAAGLFERADAALRHSKDEGKDRVTSAAE